MLTSGEIAENDLARWMRMVAEQSVGHAYVFTDVAGTILWWSPGAERMFSRTAQSVLGKPIEDIYTQEDRQLGIAAHERHIAESDATSEDDRWHVRADGSRFWATGTMSAIRSADGSLLGFAKVLRDRNALKEQLERRSNELAAATSADEGKTAAITTLSHELRNLVAAVVQGSRLVRSNPDPQRQHELLGMLEQQAHAVYRLTEDFLDASRISMHRLSIRKSRLSLSVLLKQVVGTLQPGALKKRLQLALLAPAGEIYVDADEIRLYQVFNNLIENAIKYTGEGGRIWVKLTVEDLEAVVHVEDSGIGIPAHMLTRIFGLFTQADTPIAHQGLGVGLAIVKEIVSLHGGSVQAASTGEGEGSQFTVRLPLLATSVETVPDATNFANAANPAQSSCSDV